MRNKRNATITAVVGAVVLTIFLWLIVRDIGLPNGRPLTTLSPQGEQAVLIQNLSIPVFIVAGVIFLIVQVGILWLVARFRRTKDDVDGVDEPEQVHGNTPLEIAWTVVPALILAVLAVFNVQTILALPNAEDPIEITVVGQQWWWEYQYDLGGEDGPEIITATQAAIPVGRDVVFKIQANDVIHSFWIPALNGKKDGVPGRTHELVLTARNPGIYEGQCTEFCGLSHGVMRMQVKALPQAEYDRWIERMTTAPQAPQTEDEIAGQALFVGQCSRCHEINGLTPDSQEPYEYADRPTYNYGEVVGSPLSARNAPNLTHFMMRQSFAGGLLATYEGDATSAVVAVPEGTPNTNNIKRWLRNPLDVKPMDPDNNQGMPNLNLSEEQIDQLTAYLVTLK
jgi:cytochrome c oxidase subunit II